jgi:hypothetical protein
MRAALSPPASEPQARGLAGRLIGVVTSPRSAYADVARRPSWLGGLIVILAISVTCDVWMLSTEVGRQAAVDQQLQTLEAFGQTVSDEQYRRMQEMAPNTRYFAAAGHVIGFPLAALVISAVAFAVFNGVLGDSVSFRPLFAVVIFSGAISAVRALFSTPLNYARESLSSPTSLAAVLPFFADDTFVGRLFGSLDLFLIWWTVSLAIGLGVLYKRRTVPIATTMLGVYGAIGLTIAAVRSVLAGA